MSDRRVVFVVSVKTPKLRRPSVFDDLDTAIHEARCIACELASESYEVATVDGSEFAVEWDGVAQAVVHRVPMNQGLSWRLVLEIDDE